MKFSPLHSLRVLLLVALLVVPARGNAAIDGEAELGYVDYRSKANGASASASSFLQRYSLMYSQNGMFGGGSDGFYKASLGYEWGSMRTTIAMPGSEQTLSVNDGHILYNGELRYIPQRLPLYLKLYSRDQHRLAFDRNADAYVFNGDPVIHPDVPVNVFGGGSFITNGATLLLGNGWASGLSSLSNSIADDLPLLSVGYNDQLVRDLKSLTPRHSTQRHLRVSLSKGGNYLHYFLDRIDDFLTPSLSSSEQRYVLGNLDTNLNRTWIDLTNWIRVSVDGSYNKSSGPIAIAPVRYEANAFARLTRDTWDASLHSGLERRIYADHVSYESRTPLYVKGTLGSNTDWQSNVRYEVRKDVGVNDLRYYRSDARATMRLTTFKRSDFTLSPRLLVERIEENADKLLVLGLNLESASTRRYSDRLSLLGAYDVRWEKFEGTLESAAVTQTLEGRAIYLPSSTYKVELRQQFSLATGERKELGQEVRQGQVQTSLGGTYFDQLSRPRNGYLYSATSLRGDWYVGPRFVVAAQVERFMQDASGIGLESVTTMLGTLRYTGANATADANIMYAITDKVSQGSRSLSAYGNLTYSPNQVTSSALRFRLQSISYDVGDTDTSVLVRQEFNYAYFPANGMRRKLLDLSEAIVHETNRGFTRTSLLVGTRYYPLQRLYIAFDGRYTLRHEPEHDSEFAGSGEIGVVYSKLQASLNYSYGQRTGSGDNRIDKRLAANVKKQF